MAGQEDVATEATTIPITLTHHGKEHTLDMDPSATLSDFSVEIQDIFSIPTSNQKLMVPKLGMLKSPFDDRPITDLQDKKITLLGTSNAEIASLNTASQKAAAREAHLASSRRNPPKAFSSASSPAGRRRAQEESQYTFLALRALPNLPRPERSLAVLERLQADPGVRAAMRAHRFTVGLLTELEPLSNTAETHEGTTRLRGLNRNRGEVIELRLRTDAYDGYRDYRTVRDTLCHELAHNVHSEHDRQFWDLCHQIEREVARADWKSGGQSVGGGGVYYEPVEEIAYDHGGWTGGEFVLGGGGRAGQVRGGSSSANAHSSGGTLSRREIMAKAAEERLKKKKQAQAEPGEEASGSQDTSG